MAEHGADQETMQSIVAVDNMLLNAYATVYKMAHKYISYQAFGCELSSLEEMTFAKIIVSDLWSVLDHCCTILYHRHYGTPSPSTAKKISFPTVNWKKNFIVAELAKLPGPAYAKFAGAFSSIQYQGERVVPPDTRAFYRLHFLRNKLTHRTMSNPEDRVNLQQLELLRDNNITESESEVATMIKVPREPWKKENEEYDEVPLLDVLYQACKVVEDRRDKLLNTIGEQKFNNRYVVELRKEGLIITLNNKRHELQCNKLQLESYGIATELDELRTIANC